MSTSEDSTKLARGIYLLPTLLTLGALFAGFYAVVAAMKGKYEYAAIAIFVAMMMDSLDGRIARLTNTQSAFGAELDSLSDMVSFGVAPALVIYSWSLFSIGKVGWLVSFIYTACVAMRLARFNTQLAKGDKRYFRGLASPLAAGVLASWVWLCVDQGLTGVSMRLLSGVFTVFLALLMVSHFRYRSFKDLDLRDKVPYMALLIIILTFAVVFLYPPLVLFLIFTAYALSGPCVKCWACYQKCDCFCSPARCRACCGNFFKRVFRLHKATPPAKKPSSGKKKRD